MHTAHPKAVTTLPNSLVVGLPESSPSLLWIHPSFARSGRPFFILYSMRMLPKRIWDPMAKDNNSVHFHRLCYFLFALSTLSSFSFLYWSQRPSPPCSPDTTSSSSWAWGRRTQSVHLLSFTSAWNRLAFSPAPPPRHLKIALFVKKWPQGNLAGGLERHALTLHLALARRGHELHVFTASPDPSTAPEKYPDANIRFHLTRPTAAGYLNQPPVWEQFRAQNSTGRPFDVVHTESVALFHGRARNVTNLAVSWHGIAYETVHSDIVQDLLRAPEDTRKPVLAERLSKVVDEVRFFRDYAHHVATSDHVGDVLKRIYWIPEQRVHVIVNGVDEEIYGLDRDRGRAFREEHGVPPDAALVMGMAGRLVKDKGHPVMFEALKQLLEQDASFQRRVFVLVAGDGPWASRYKELYPNVIVLGPLDQTHLATFYTALDVFVNPTLRAQGLDHTFMEAMLSGVPVAGTRFASITGSVITDADAGYTFLPTVESIKEALYKIWGEGTSALRKKGEAARQRALQLFTATKMATAYERLFLCIAQQTQGWKDGNDYCTYPLPWDGSSSKTRFCTRKGTNSFSSIAASILGKSRVPDVHVTGMMVVLSLCFLLSALFLGFVGSTAGMIRVLMVKESGARVCRCQDDGIQEGPMLALRHRAFIRGPRYRPEHALVVYKKLHQMQGLRGRTECAKESGVGQPQTWHPIEVKVGKFCLLFSNR